MVLVVDDSPTETYILKNFLEKAGYSVATAADGQQGVAKAREIKPLFILMDVVMPVLNGFQATRQLGNDPETKAIPVIMVTTKDQETDKSWGMKQGASAYLVKPITERDLMAAIKGLKLP
ncbi:MAG: response regulator [Pseudomonadota bacterium]